MAIVTKTIRGRAYLYEQTSKRVDSKVKTTSIYIGPAVGRVRPRPPSALTLIGGLISSIHQREHVFDMDVLLREAQQVDQQKADAVATHLADLHQRFGMVLSGPRTPVPIEKAARNVMPPALLSPATPETDAPQQDTPSDITDGAVEGGDNQ